MFTPTATIKFIFVIGIGIKIDQFKWVFDKLVILTVERFSLNLQVSYLRRQKKIIQMDQEYKSYRVGEDCSFTIRT